MRNYSLFITVASMIFGISSAVAEERMGRVIFEPEVGYVFSGSLATNGGPADKVTGLDVGGRLGIRLGHVLILGGSFKYLPSVSFIPDGGTALSPNPTLMEAGAFLGFQFSKLRIWGGYNFMDSLKNIQLSGVTASLTGKSFFAGGGIKIFPSVSLNAEVIFPTYSTMEASVEGISVSGPLDPSYSGKYFLATLSFPLNL